MISQTGKQIITIHILLDISGSKGNQAMKIGQFIHSHKKSHTKNVV